MLVVACLPASRPQLQNMEHDQLKVEARSLREGKLGGFHTGVFPTFSREKVRIVSRTLPGLFLVGALNFKELNWPRKRKNPFKKMAGSVSHFLSSCQQRRATLQGQPTVLGEPHLENSSLTHKAKGFGNCRNFRHAIRNNLIKTYRLGVSRCAPSVSLTDPELSSIKLH